MDKISQKTNIFTLFFNSLLLYIKNIISLTRIMLFPVFGQLAGIILIFLPTYYFKTLYLQNLPPEYVQGNIMFILFSIIIVIIPGFFIFTRAFWEYMIALITLNIAISDIVKSGDMDEDTRYGYVIKKRSGDYIYLLMILTIIWLALTIFPFIGIIIFNSMDIFKLLTLCSILFAAYLLIKLGFVFQIFSFKELAPQIVIKNSWNLTKGYFFHILFFGLMYIIITNIFPPLISSLIEATPLFGILTLPVTTFLELFNNNPDLMTFITSLKLTPYNIVIATIQIITASIMLPLGSTMFTLLYFEIMSRKKLS